MTKHKMQIFKVSLSLFFRLQNNISVIAWERGLFQNLPQHLNGEKWDVGCLPAFDWTVTLLWCPVLGRMVAWRWCHTRQCIISCSWFSCLHRVDRPQQLALSLGTDTAAAATWVSSCFRFVWLHRWLLSSSPQRWREGQRDTTTWLPGAGNHAAASPDCRGWGTSQHWGGTLAFFTDVSLLRLDTWVLICCLSLEVGHFNLPLMSHCWGLTL